MSTLIVSVEDSAMLSKIKTAIEQLRGVTCVSEGESYDVTDCDAFREAMDDIKHGRVFSASSAKDLINQALG